MVVLGRRDGKYFYEVGRAESTARVFVLYFCKRGGVAVFLVVQMTTIAVRDGVMAAWKP